MFLDAFKRVKKVSQPGQICPVTVTAICELTLTQLLLNFSIRQD